ncbi:hypothetical protein JTB14_037520 [Gonioctena quinquepunctata]|nr:hypothetical protein JTB14_037520 [Gonioctena quinquepunctata]
MSPRKSDAQKTRKEELYFYRRPRSMRNIQFGGSDCNCEISWGIIPCGTPEGNYIHVPRDKRLQALCTELLRRKDKQSGENNSVPAELIQQPPCNVQGSS